jgi:hypothetical protein
VAGGCRVKLSFACGARPKDSALKINRLSTDTTNIEGASMAIQHLTDEQISTWTREQKDQWWFDNVYRGDMPQLTLRSALTGFVLGGVHRW